MHALIKWQERGLLLRNFFMFNNTQTMKEIIGEMSEMGITPAKNEQEYLSLEYLFNRLFVGPMNVPAPPYASIYLEQEPQLMGKSTLEIRQLFHSIGLESENENHVPDDHIAYEIEACVLLDKLRKENVNYAEALSWLVNEHMKQWLPLFILNIQKEIDPEIDGASTIKMIVANLSQWFDELQRRIA